ncbi:cerebellin-3-like [Tachysurus fulvidraco]|uniref:cerebellin-3-like n=1 Tax=Tachysurus fulvidraco TaxID=1234273 RepID=UPI000F50EC04|nr:cerebellin-3-like [Tachysurus fulvidraco]
MKPLLILASLLLLVQEISSEDIMTPSMDILTELKSIKERMKVMEEEITDLRRENRDQATRLETLNTSRCGTEDLLPTNKDVRVAFSAFLLNTVGPRNVGPFTYTTTLIYKHVFLNIGEAYDPNTGVFTAPLKGAYVFRVFSKAAGQPANSMTAGLYKNSQHMFSTHAHQTGGFYSSSNGASLPLEKGDTVSVRLYAGTWIFDNGAHHHSSFSGHLLFPL